MSFERKSSKSQTVNRQPELLASREQLSTEKANEEYARREQIKENAKPVAPLDIIEVEGDSDDGSDTVSEDSDEDDEEADDDDKSNQPRQDVDLLDLSDVPENFQFDPSKGHKKVIGVYTEKGGVGKTNFILSCVRSGVFNRILVIDTDPQNNVVNGFMTPTIIRETRHFMDCADFVSDSFREYLHNQDRIVQPASTSPSGKKAFSVPLQNGTSVTIVLGAPLSDSGEMFDSERKFKMGGPKTMYAKQLITHIRHQLDHYDVVLIDFNPKMSLINKILLMACDEVVQLVTGDIHSQSAITSLSTTRDEECKIFVPAGDQYGPQRFNITIVPSLIDRSRKTLRQGHKAFVEKIFYFVKERFTGGCTDIFFRGYVGRSHSMYGERPIKLLLSQKEPGSRADVAKMVEDVKRILLHCIQNTKEDMTRHPYVFPWDPAATDDECTKLLKLLKRERQTPMGVLYIFVSGQDPKLYKIGITKSTTERRKTATATFKCSWQLVKGFVSTRAVVRDLEKKLLDYFSTSADVGETIRIRDGDARSELFLDMFNNQLNNRQFVESLLLES